MSPFYTFSPLVKCHPTDSYQGCAAILGKVGLQGPPTLHQFCASLPQAHPFNFPLLALPSRGKKCLYNIQDLKATVLKCTSFYERNIHLPSNNCWRRKHFWCNVPHANFIMETQAAIQNKRLQDISFIFRMNDSLAFCYERCKQTRTSILLLTAQKLDRFLLLFLCIVIISSTVLAHFHAWISLVYMWLHWRPLYLQRSSIKQWEYNLLIFELSLKLFQWWHHTYLF